MNKKLVAGMTIGSDPELMLWDRHQGRIVSSIPVLKQDKHNPIDLGDGAKMYADNVLVETSFPPSDTKSGFMSTIRKVFGKMHNHLGTRYQLLPKTAHIYDARELAEKKAVESGCSENFAVYEQRKGPPPPFSSGLRTGSFHIHIGHDELLNPQNKDKMVKILDIYLGCASIVFDGDETSPMRRSLYGKAGEFRPTSYGVEYRVLGNFALRSPKTTELVVDLVEHSLETLLDGNGDKLLATIKPDEVQNAINNNMRGLSKSILMRAGVNKTMMSRIGRSNRAACSVAAWE
jgi:hypothetical protein